jgi:hypothetical protein
MIYDRPEKSEAIPSAILGGGTLPILAMLVWGSIFDSRGANAFMVTIMDLFQFSPVWILCGIGFGIAYYKVPKMRWAIWLVDTALISVMFVWLVLVP